MKILPILLATTLTIYTNAAFLPLTVYAAEESASAEESAAAEESASAEEFASAEESTSAEEFVSAEEFASAEVETEQEGEVQELTAEELTAEVPDAAESVTGEAAVEEPAVEELTVEEPVAEEPSSEEPVVEELTVEESLVEGRSVAAESSAAQVPSYETTDDASSGDTAAEAHRLVFASDFHNTEGSIQNAMEGMPEDVEYVSFVGDMVGERGGSHPEYESDWILDMVTDIFPNLDNTGVSIVWATHDANVIDEGTGIVKCKDGVSEPIREGTDEDGSPAYYIYGIGHYDMTKGSAGSQAAAGTFKKWVEKINHTVPVIVLCHVPIQAARGDNNGASYWNEALNFAATGVEGITDTSKTASITRNVLFLHGHNHTNDPVEYYFGAGGTMNVQVDNSGKNEGASGSAQPPHRPGRNAEGVLSNIYYTSLTAGYLKTSGSASLVTVFDGALQLLRYSAGQIISLGTDGTSKEAAGNSVTIAAQRHVEGQGIVENVRAATCGHGGEYDLVYCCAICGEELYRTHMLTEAAGHHWSEWKVVREAMPARAGEERRICDVCGEIETRMIMALVPEKDDEPDPADSSEGAESTLEDAVSEDSGNVVEAGGTDSCGTDSVSIAASGAGSVSILKQGSGSDSGFVSPQTGDDSQCVMWAVVMCLAMVLLVKVPVTVTEI